MKSNLLRIIIFVSILSISCDSINNPFESPPAGEDSTGESLNLENVGIHDDFEFSLHSGGTGCPEGTLNGNLSEDKKKLSLNFNSYSVTSSTSNIDRVPCAVAIPITLSENVQVAVYSRDYTGNATIEDGEGKFHAEAFLTGNTGQNDDIIFAVGTTGIFAFNPDDIDDNDLTWSGCGGENEIVRVNSSINITGTELNTSSINVSGFNIGLKYRTCSE